MSLRVLMYSLLLVSAVPVSATPASDSSQPQLPAYLCAWESGGPYYGRLIFGAESLGEANRTAREHLEKINVPVSNFIKCMKGSTTAPPYTPPPADPIEEDPDEAATNEEA